MGGVHFKEWFVGFSEGKGCYKIKPRYRGDKSKVHSFSFEFEIHLHIDEKPLLDKICYFLGVGKVNPMRPACVASGDRIKRSSCSFVVGDDKGIRELLHIFDNYKMNGIKYLDYQDFRKAFLLYINRTGILTDDIISEILVLQRNINTKRIDFTMPLNHQVEITPYWLLGLVEAEGSFYLKRDPIRPGFQILLTSVQEPLLIKIKEYLKDNLGFDSYSIWKINNSSVISVSPKKAVGHSKLAVTLDIWDINILTNYLLPSLQKLNFLSKKQLQDFKDFTIICQTVYNGGHEIELIRNLIVKLSEGMNDFRLSNYKGKIPKKYVTKKELSLLINSIENPILEHLADGRVRDIVTGNIDYNNESSVYSIIDSNKEELIVGSLKETANIVGIHYTTLSKKLRQGVPSRKTTGASGQIAPEALPTKLKGYSIRRIKVFLERQE